MLHPLHAHALVTAACLTLVVACAPSREAAFDPAREQIERRTGQRTAWRERGPLALAAPAVPDDELDDVVATLLERELDLDAAAQVALLHNRALQARFEDIGVARARLVQATLFANPTLSGEVLFPITGDEVRGGIGVELDFLSSLFRAPQRRLATAALEATQLEVAAFAVSVAFEARAALIEHLAAKQRVAVLERLREAASLTDEVTTRLYEAGNITRLVQLDGRRVLLDADAHLLEQREALARSRARLSQALGVAPDRWRVGEGLPPAGEDPYAGLERRAFEQSLELAALRRRVDVAGRALGLEDARRFLPALEIGGQLEQEEGLFAGPSASLTVPLLDVGQARVAEREAALRQLLERYAALAVAVRAKARSVHDELVAARTIARAYREEVAPLAARRVEEAVLQYNAMALGVLDLLERKQDQLEAEDRQVAALARTWRLTLEAEALLAGVRLAREAP